ncbi:SGNH/GDSL hydrolase family protein [Compostibacter hankyongensis]|uniref:SGNH/GDSL hydrolase family protein n=2 Tax=Compostibacter hankyongensis TaxID=1007089 RepID=A0ABP8FH19_9BACT
MTLAAGSCSAQSGGIGGADAVTDSLIAASQAGAMPVFFDPGSPQTSLVAPGSFKDDGECRVRGGLSGFFDKAEAGKPLTIGFIGGSITRADGMYRNQAAKFIQHLYPAVKIKAVNAGIAGTGTDLGACRIREQLLKYHPDLVFIEFAVNGAFRPGMEGIIRQIRKCDPNTDICLLYTIAGEQSRIYARGQIPPNIRGLEEIAAYYHLPSVHMGMEAAMLQKQGKLLWKADTSVPGKIVFSKDGTHPLETGGDLYAKAIARALLKIRQAGIPQKQAHPLPPPLLDDNWEDACMLDPREAATFSSGWKAVDPAGVPLLQSFKPWFPYIMAADTPGASFTFRFRGTMVGVFDIGGPGSGQLLLTVDGKTVKQINRFNRYCNNRYRGQCEFITLPPGLHTVRFSISPVKADKAAILGPGQQQDITRHPEKYDRTAELLGKLLIRGTVVVSDAL